MAGVLALVGLLSGCPEDKGEYNPVCDPKCEGMACGVDPCGNPCGSCGAGMVCADGQCVAGGDVLADAAGADTGEPFEVVIPDASPAKICIALEAQFLELLEGASACDGPLDCSVVIEHGMPCSCALYASDPSVDGKLGKVVGEYVARQCDDDVLCESCPFLQVPSCSHGLCEPSTPTCQGIEGLYAEVLAAARACEADADCTGQVSGSLECGCKVPANGTAWAGWFDLAAEYWQVSECGMPAPCECIEWTETMCIEGTCEVAIP